MRAAELLRAGLRQLGLTASGGVLDRFALYRRELKRWNRAYNLTALKSDEDIVVKHFLDSCLYLKAMENLPAKGGPSALADVGSGAGFPGIALKIFLPGTEIFLIEPSGKKSAFLRHVIRTLSLKKISVIEKRVEEVKDIEVDVVVTRALFKAKDFIKKAGHMAVEGGFFVLSKGPRAEEELKGSGLDYELKVLPLPMSDIKRYFVIIRKGMKKTGSLTSTNPAYCANSECRLRRAGCRSFVGCPGYRAGDSG